MNIRDLEYIRAVARLGHFGLAAEACNVSQPALSSQIKKLEEELGVVLFERNNKSVRTTRVGERVVALAVEALDVVAKIKVTAEMAHDPLHGNMRVGCIPTVAPFLLPRMLRSARTSLPNLKFSFQEDLTQRLTRELLDGTLDAALLATAPEDGALCEIPLYDEPFWVIYPSGHTLSRADTIRTEDLPVSDLLLLSEGHCFRDQALDVCQLSAPGVSQTLQATSLGTLINLVAAEEGITLVPAMALENVSSGMGLVAKKLREETATRRISLCYRKSFPRVERLLATAEVIRNCLPDSVCPIR